MFTNLIHGLSPLGDPQALAYLIIGSVIGVVLGVIPGIGGIVLLTMVLAFISHISLVGAICLFLAVQAAGYFSASITSILLNTPAHPEAFPVTFDGFPMARAGQPGKALGISASSTCIGGLIGCLIFVALIPAVNKLPLIFHPPELALLVIIAMLLVATLGAQSVSKALISVAIGIMMASIGPSPITGDFRYTFGAVGLSTGISLVALALGSFAVPQMILVYGTATTIARQDMMGRQVESIEAIPLVKGFGGQVIDGVRESFRHWVLLIQSGVIGAITGIIPGIGGFAANFLSYGIARQTSKRRQLFGTGIAEGIIAPEGSSLSKEAGGLLPIIGLGIPGGVGGALFIAALAIKGVKVGFGFTTEYPTLPYEMIWVVALGGLIGTTLGLLSASTLARITRVPGPALVPFMLVLSVVGSFVSDTAFFSVMEMFVLAVVGFILRRLRYSLASFAIGLVLASYLEQDVDLTSQIFPHLSWLHRPLSIILLVLAVLILASKVVEMRRDAREERARIQAKVRDSQPAQAAQGSTAERDREVTWLLEAERNPYPFLGLVTSLVITGVGVAFVIYALGHFDFATGITPELAGGVAMVAGAWRSLVDGRAYLRARALAAYRAQSGITAVASGVINQPSSRFPEISENAWGWRGQYTREIFAFAWLAGLVGGCFLFGFLVAVPLFCLAYGATSTGRILNSVRTRAIFAITSAVIMWALTFSMIQVLHLAFTPVIGR